jgi:DNA mismatch endonuclease (patch repair protein)
MIADFLRPCFGPQKNATAKQRPFAESRQMDRSENMRAVRGKDTKPEKAVRSMLHKLGYRFRLHRRDLPGKPDLVFPSLRKVIFVHGCFWHSHDCRKGRGAPSTNSQFWKRKRELTVERDRKVLEALAAEKWDAYVVWECSLKNLDAVSNQLEEFLSRELPPVRQGSRQPGGDGCLKRR